VCQQHLNVLDFVEGESELAEKIRCEGRAVVEASGSSMFTPLMPDELYAKDATIVEPEEGSRTGLLSTHEVLPLDNYYGQL